MTIEIPLTSAQVRSALCALVLSGVLLGFAPPIQAGEPNGLSLAAVVQEAREHNPELQAARGRSQAMRAVPRQVSAYDDPTVSWEAWNAPESLRVDRADNNIFRVSQRIPFPGKRRLAGEVAEREADQAAHDAESVELELVASVKRAYYELWAAYERHAVVTRQRELVRRFTHVVEQRYATGQAVQADVLRAQVELTHLTNQLQTEGLAIEQAEAELRALLSRRADQDLGRPEHPSPPRLVETPAALIELAETKRPDIAAQTAAIAREESAVKLAHRNYYPDFEVSVGRFVNHRDADGFGAMASVTVPIFNRGKYGAALDEATARLGSARAERQRLDDRLRREVEQAYLRARSSLLQYELFTKTHIPQAEQALRATEAGYETGNVGFLDVVETRRGIEALHLEHIEAQAAFEKAYADLERVVGAELPRTDPPQAVRGRGGKHDE